MITLYKEKDSLFYYMEKDKYGAYFHYASTELEPALASNIKQALNYLNSSIKSRRKGMLSSVTKQPHRFELIGEVDSVSDIIAILTLLEA